MPLSRVVIAVAVLMGSRRVTNAAPGTGAPRPAGDVVDSIVRARMDEFHVVGAAVAVMQRGKVLKSAAYGLANITTKEPVTPQTAFFVASLPVPPVVGRASTGKGS